MTIGDIGVNIALMFSRTTNPSPAFFLFEFFAAVKVNCRVEEGELGVSYLVLWSLSHSRLNESQLWQVQRDT